MKGVRELPLGGDLSILSPGLQKKEEHGIAQVPQPLLDKGGEDGLPPGPGHHLEEDARQVLCLLLVRHRKTPPAQIVNGFIINTLIYFSADQL